MRLKNLASTRESVTDVVVVRLVVLYVEGGLLRREHLSSIPHSRVTSVKVRSVADVICKLLPTVTEIERKRGQHNRQYRSVLVFMLYLTQGKATNSGR